MRRWVPVMFYVGLFLLCSSAMVLAQWPRLMFAFARTGFDAELVVGVPSGEHFVLSGMLTAGVAALVGLALVFARRAALGGVTLGLAAVAGVLVIIAGALPAEARTLADSADPVLALQLFAGGFAACVGAAWLLLQRQRRVAASGLAGFGIAAAMVAAACFGIERSLADEQVLWWPLVAALGAGVVLSVQRPLFVSRLVSVAVLCAGLVATVPAIAVAHDLELELSPAKQLFVDREQSLPIVRCERLRGGIVVVADARPAREGPFARPVMLFVPESGSLERVRERLEGLEAAGVHDLELVFAAYGVPATTWTRPALHVHQCAARVTLSDDGVPLDAFADWPSLAADVPGKLRLH